MTQPLTLFTPTPAPAFRGARIIEFRTRAAGKSESSRRAVLIDKLRLAASRAKDPHARAIWLHKASLCGHLSAQELRGPAPALVTIEIREAPPPPRWRRLRRWMGWPLLMVVVAALPGCYPADTSDYQRNNLSGGEVTKNEFGVFTDPDTECQYIVWNGMERGGITPRLGTDGKPICGVRS